MEVLRRYSTGTQAEPPTITGAFTFEYPNVYIAIQTISKDAVPDNMERRAPRMIAIAPKPFTSSQPPRARKVRRDQPSVFKLKDPLSVFAAHRKLPQNASNWQQEWDNSVSFLGGGCISPRRFKRENGRFKYEGGSMMKRHGFKGSHGEFTGSSLDIDALMDFSGQPRNYMEIPTVFNAPFCGNLQLLPNRVYPEEGFTLPVCNCKGRLQIESDVAAHNGAENGTVNLRCAASMFRWQYDAVTKEMVKEALNKEIPQIQTSEIVVGDFLTKVPQRLVLVGEQSLLDLTPKQQVLIDLNTDPDPINDPALLNANKAETQVWIPRLFSAVPDGISRFNNQFKSMATMGPVSAAASSIPNVAFILGDDFSGRNTILSDDLTLAFRGTQVTAGSHVFQIPSRSKLVIDGSVTLEMTPTMRSNTNAGQPKTNAATMTQISDSAGSTRPVTPVGGGSMAEPAMPNFTAYLQTTNGPSTASENVMTRTVTGSIATVTSKSIGPKGASISSETSGSPGYKQAQLQTQVSRASVAGSFPLVSSFLWVLVITIVT
jgi:hypothetical protein